MRRITPIAALLVLPLCARAEAPAIDVADDAKPAVIIVDRFFTALKAGELEKAGAELDPGVLILDSGGAERSAAEYPGGHAKGDAAFLKEAHHKQLHRRTPGELHVQCDGRPATIVSTETMILRSDHAGWKIVHMHGSSRPRKQYGAAPCVA